MRQRQTGWAAIWKTAATLVMDRLDKDGNYVCPNPNDTSDEEDYTEESNWDDQTDDYNNLSIFEKKVKKTKLVSENLL